MKMYASVMTLAWCGLAWCGLAWCGRQEAREALHALRPARGARGILRARDLRPEYCEPHPLEQRVRAPGCLTRTVLDRSCYGQCNSFYVPRAPSPRAPDAERPAFRSCAACKPKKYSWTRVTLRCPALQPPIRRVRLRLVRTCRCLPYE